MVKYHRFVVLASGSAQSEGEAPEDRDGMTNVDSINSMPSHHPTLQDCLLVRRTGIIASP